MYSATANQRLVQQLELQLECNPGAYKMKLAALAAFGFLVLGGTALLGLATSAGLVVGLVMVSPLLLVKLLKVVWIPVAFGVTVLYSMWVRFEVPNGYRLKPKEAPLLQKEVERLRAATGAPKLHGIIIDPNLNAAAAALPRAMGLLGQKHYLVLGLPLMKILERDELAAVIAHEFGHFGGGHHRFSGWIYRVRMSWYRLLDGLADGGWAAQVLGRFFEWYAPLFNAYSFPLARANEYEADAMSARVAGAEAAGRALVRLRLAAESLERDFWPGVQPRPGEMPPTLVEVYARMVQHLQATPAVSDEHLARALECVAGYDDTHPTLAQRLSALGIATPVPRQLQTSSADALLGPLQPRLQQHFAAAWAG